jgi:uncharacterized protein involved in exopolysaccharide biosynthesis/Mrp family chromosome partitioning ATPase
LASKEKNYLIKASIQLKDQGLSEKGNETGKFINGLELLESNAELEDEIAILSSYSNISQAIQRVGHYNTIYQYNRSFAPVNRYFAKENYQDLTIKPDINRPQLVDVPVHISFIDKSNYIVEIDVDKGDLYDYQSHKSLGNAQNVSFAAMGKVGVPFVNPYISFTLEPNPNSLTYLEKDYYYVNHTLKNIAENYQGRLKVVPIADNSNIVNIILQGVVPEKEIHFLNTLATVYVENDLDKRNKLGFKTIDFIDNQLSKVADTLRDVEGLLESFRAQSNVVDISVSSQMLTNLLNELEEKQIERKSQHKYYRHIADNLLTNSALTEVVAPSAVGINDPTLNRLLEDLTTLNRERVSVLYNSNSDKNPVLRNIDQKIAKTKKSLEDNIKSLIERSAIAIRENQRRIDEVKLDVSKLPKNERNLNIIQRKFELNDNVYKYLLEKRAEAGIVLASNAPDKSIIDTARQVGNKAVSPNQMSVFLIAFMVGLFFPAGFILLKDFFAGAVENEEQLEKAINIPVISSVSYDAQRKKYGPITANPYNENAFRYNENAFRSICHYIKFRDLRTIGVTSMVTSEGKTYCATNLAVTLARSGFRTLLIDTDVYKADLSTIFFVPIEPESRDNESELRKLQVHPTPIKHLDIMSLGKWTAEAAFGSIADVLAVNLPELKRGYEYIVLDTSPVGIVPDYLSIADLLDHTIIVVRNNVTKQESLKKLNKIIIGNELLQKSTIIYNGQKSPREVNDYYRKIAG